MAAMVVVGQKEDPSTNPTLLSAQQEKENGNKEPEEENDDDNDDEDDEGEENVENGGEGVGGKKKKKKKKPKKKKKAAGIPGTKLPVSRLLGGFTDYYLKYGQTDPPTKLVADLFPTGVFPEGEIQPHSTTKRPDPLLPGIPIRLYPISQLHIPFPAFS